MSHTYRINEIFYSLQGEGFWTGTPAVFVRFSGCNLRCPFCDTDHRSSRLMELPALVDQVRREAGESTAPLVVLTGGEPGLQVDDALVAALHDAGFRVHIETNGTCPLPSGIDWVTLSPKCDVPGVAGSGSGAAAVRLTSADEIKVVYAAGDDPARWASFPATWHFLQPCAEPAAAPAATVASAVTAPAASVTDSPAAGAAASATARNTAACVAYILSHPTWRLSLQTHKLLSIR